MFIVNRDPDQFELGVPEDALERRFSDHTAGPQEDFVMLSGLQFTGHITREKRLKQEESLVLSLERITTDHISIF